MEKRKLKFRAFYKGQMIYNVNLEVTRGEHYFTDGKDILLDVPLMQSTGLKDKNGKEIWEGDIFTMSSGNSVVKFKNGGFGWDSVMWEGDFIGFAGHVNFHKIMPRCEVLGNIYENPELLKSA